MSPLKILLVLVAVLLSLVVVRAVLALVATVFAALMTLAGLLVLAAIIYGGYVVWSSIRNGTEGRDGIPEETFGTDSIGTESTDRISELQERYANGELSEAEFERRVEYELESEEFE